MKERTYHGRDGSIRVTTVTLGPESCTAGKVPGIRDVESLSKKLPSICSSIFEVIGSQQTESTYQRALKIDLEEAGSKVHMEPEIELMYKGQVVGTRRPDLILTMESGEKAVLELKAVDKMQHDHVKQIEYYMHHTGIHRGYLINFPHDTTFQAVDDKSFFSMKHLCGLIEKMDHWLKGMPTLRLRNDPQKRSVEIVEVYRRDMTAKEREDAVQRKRTEAATQPAGTFGRKQNGEWCTICIREGRYCRFHVDQQEKA
jgi:GxxExxY protein